jgi:hypothetical protein
MDSDAAALLLKLEQQSWTGAQHNSAHEADSDPVCARGLRAGLQNMGNSCYMVPRRLSHRVVLAWR